MQSDALLKSYKESVTNPAKLFILYRTTTKVYDTAYNELFSNSNSKDIFVLKENNF
jgi:hypothetical protein